MAAIVGTGTTIAFATSSFAPEVTSITGNGRSRTVLQTSHMGTTGSHTKIVGDLIDEGDVSIEFWLDGDAANGLPTFATTSETVTITFPDGSNVSGPAFVTNFSFSSPLEELITGSLTVTWADDATYAAV